MQSIEWLGMLFLVPDDWEIVRHSVNEKTGSLILVDRRCQRMQVTWTYCEKKLCENDVFDDLKKRDIADNPECKTGDLQSYGRFNGYRRICREDILVRAGLYDEKQKLWIDVVLPVKNNDEEKTAVSVLESYASSRKDDRYLRLRAFGLDAASPEGWKLVGADVKPALITFRYEHNGEKAEITRAGGADAWFDGNLETFLNNRITDSTGIYKEGTRLGHASCGFIGKEQRLSIRWLLGKRRIRKDTVWYCPESRAVFHAVVTGTRNKVFSTESFLVNCCKKSGPKQ
jgi:hypothetical protein